MVRCQHFVEGQNPGSGGMCRHLGGAKYVVDAGEWGATSISGRYGVLHTEVAGQVKISKMVLLGKLGKLTIAPQKIFVGIKHDNTFVPLIGKGIEDGA
ncbi:hypothetical protein ACA910_010357 [Epithemia clementina (nom. ined.)]